MSPKWFVLEKPWKIDISKWDPISPIAYLIVLEMDELAKYAKFKPDERFYEIVGKHVDAYINEGVLPPEPIRGAILNLADDQLAKRKISIRAGDYIALQQFVRSKG